MGGCARRTQGKIYEQHVSRVSGVSQRFIGIIQRRVSDFTEILSKWVRS